MPILLLVGALSAGAVLGFTAGALIGAHRVAKAEARARRSEHGPQWNEIARARALLRASLYHLTHRSGHLTYAMRLHLDQAILDFFGYPTMDDYVDAEDAEKARFLEHFANVEGPAR